MKINKKKNLKDNKKRSLFFNTTTILRLYTYIKKYLNLFDFSEKRSKIWGVYGVSGYAQTKKQKNYRLRLHKIL